jgi:hypothetical protein
MKRLLLIFLSTTFTVTLSSLAPFELEDKAQQWISNYAMNAETRTFNLSLNQTELLATALFNSYKLIKLDELAHACNRITVFFYKVLPTTLDREHNVKLSPQTVAAFATFITDGKQDLTQAYATASKNVETAVVDLEVAGDALVANAYKAVKEMVHSSVQTWAKEEGNNLWQTAISNLNEEQIKTLYTFALDPQLTQTKIAEMLVQLPLENLEDLFTFQTEMHNFVKSIWQTYLITLVESAEKAGLTKIRLRGAQGEPSVISLNASAKK